MAIQSKPAAEVGVDQVLVRALLAEQHPDLAALPLREFTAGWDNVLFRLGERWLVRLPRRKAAAALVLHEQRWLSSLAPRLPLQIPVPVRIGTPGAGYPWHWSVTRWIEGEMAAQAPPTEPLDAARVLGAFLASLHTPAPAAAPENAVRGGPLADRAAAFEERVSRLGGLVDEPALRPLWEHALAAPRWAGPALWLHGDLHPCNLLVDDGGFAAVIDFGDITAGDPATDLAVAWMLFDAPGREQFREAAGAQRPIDDATWLRARGWALHLAVTYLAHSADSPLMGSVGRRTLGALLAE